MLDLTNGEPMPFTEGQKLYRMDSLRHEPSVQVRIFTVVKVTPKGGWCEEDCSTREMPYSTKKRWFVLDAASGGKRFAYPTIEAAMFSFRCRKFKRIEALWMDMDLSLLQMFEAMGESITAFVYTTSGFQEMKISVKPEGFQIKKMNELVEGAQPRKPSPIGKFLSQDHE